MSNMYMDQASGLRKMRQNNRVKVIAVSGGKGGVGKTNVTLNVAGAMAAQGKRVLVLDADLGLANVDVMLGLRVHRNLSHVLAGECTLDDIIVEGPYGMMIVPATSGTQSMVELSPVQHAELIRAFSEMKTQVDVLLVDTAAGISDMVLSFTRAAQDIMVVVCDEPTSITDAYALIKILSKDHGVFRFQGGGQHGPLPARGAGAVRQADPGHRPLPGYLPGAGGLRALRHQPAGRGAQAETDS